jgi:hypothetical protein
MPCLQVSSMTELSAVSEAGLIIIASNLSEILLEMTADLFLGVGSGVVDREGRLRCRAALGDYPKRRSRPCAFTRR